MNEQTDRDLMKRRDFLRCGLAAGVVGLGSLAGLASLSACAGPGGSFASYGAQDAGLPSGSSASGYPTWGMVIDVWQLSAKVDFNQIADTCHKNHNVPKIDDPKTEVKWIWEDSFEHCFSDLDSEYLSSRVKELMFPVLCNHCDDPACVRVCPTQATFKRDDGIVDMDYHRCIGCRFCMSACPYNARSLNFFDPRPYLEEINPDYPTRTKGVVEKCNFCVERVEKGLKPYCVEASEGTILFGDLTDPNSDVRQVLADHLSIRRLPELGTGPHVFYLLRDGDSNA